VRVNLEMEGYTVHEAGSAEEGMKVLDELRPDLVLLDVMMPKVDGWEMLQLMHERHGVRLDPGRDVQRQGRRGGRRRGG